MAASRASKEGRDAASANQQRRDQTREGGGEITISNHTLSKELKGQATTMKAIVQDKYGSPDVLELMDIDRPVVGDDDVLVRVHAASIHSATGTS